ncbi:hypothetical protein KUTeg_015904 [Tegillarca granosa]|uniref:Uncharacterized protein n=1 Tax=Tegillarca granosa TaxID=220873 RepID=A0ABQ9EJA1_TEGGR|nr:hypothetical protein KUTeg_015904 [Tegillarca granosa]
MTKTKYTCQVITCSIPITSNAEPHGPCASFKLLDDIEYNMFCLRCGIWPFEANEWIQRRRIKNWPTQELVKEISNEEFFLGTPHQKSYRVENFIFACREQSGSLYEPYTDPLLWFIETLT